MRSVGSIVGVLGLSIFAGALPAAAEDGLITVHRLPLRLATIGIEAAMADCAKQGFDVSVAVVSREGGIQAISRADGAGVQTVQSATDKAITRAVFGIDSGIWVDRQARGEPISPLLNQLPNLLLAKGGVVVEVDGELIAGLAVAGAPGGQLDEACAKVGLAAIMSALGGAKP